MNISDMILNWIICKQYSMFGWIIKIYRPGLVSYHQFQLANNGFYFVMEQLKWTLKHHKHTILLKLRPFIEFWKGVIYKKAKCKGWNLKIDFSFNRFYGSKPEGSKDTRVHKTTEIFFILYSFTISLQSTSRPTT